MPGEFRYPADNSLGLPAAPDPETVDWDPEAQWDPPAASSPEELLQRALHHRARRISDGGLTHLPDAATARPLHSNEHLDGRYYESLFDLLWRPYVEGQPSLLPILTPDEETAEGAFQDEGALFDQALWRFESMANLITTRSDIFGITVTAQAGAGVDADGDGRINWRDSNEFMVNAEKKARTVYERPEPERRIRE